MIRLLIAIVLGFVAGSLTDWIFMGVLFHQEYKRFPEVWRDGGSEKQRIAFAQINCVLTVIGFVCLTRLVGPLSLASALEIAALVWLIGPLPLLYGNHLFIKLDPRVTFSHAIGWLVKLLLVAAIVDTL